MAEDTLIGSWICSSNRPRWYMVHVIWRR